MTWKILSPNYPALDGLTIEKISNSSLDNLISLTPIISILISLIAIVITANMSIQTQKIAKDKLELDLFIKRFSIHEDFSDAINVMTSRKSNTTVDIVKAWNTMRLAFHKSKILMEKKSVNDLLIVSNAITELYNLRFVRGSGKKINSDIKYEEKRSDVLICHKAILFIFKQYVPNLENKNIDSFSFPEHMANAYVETPDKPQPTAPAADQSPPTP